MTRLYKSSKLHVVMATLALLMLAGCDSEMSYEEHQKYEKACIDHDMKAYNVIGTGWHTEQVVIGVRCKDSNGDYWDAANVLGEQ